MKLYTQKHLYRAMIFGLLLIFGASCATRVDFPYSPSLPAAEIKAKVKQNKSDIYEINIDANYLADPQRLVPEKARYIAWILSPDGEYHVVGELDPGNDREAELKTMTPYEPTEILITAEDRKQPRYPSAQEVFRSERINLEKGWLW